MLAGRILRLIEAHEAADPAETDRLIEEALAERPVAAADPLTVSAPLERAAFERTVAEYLPAGRLPVLALTPAPETSSSTSQSPLVEHLLEHHGAPESLRAFGPRGVEIAAGRSWLAARQRDRKVAVVSGHSSAISDLLETLARRHLKFRLPPASVVLDLVTPGEPWCATDLIGDSLGAGAVERLFRVYTPPRGVTSFVARDRGESEAPLFVPPPWTRVRVTDGETGPLTVLDLAGFESEGVEIKTADRATLTDDGFRLV